MITIMEEMKKLVMKLRHQQKNKKELEKSQFVIQVATSITRAVIMTILKKTRLF